MNARPASAALARARKEMQSHRGPAYARDGQSDKAWGRLVRNVSLGRIAEGFREEF